MRQSLLLWVLPPLLLLLYSCEDQFAELGELDGVRYRAEYAIPLVDSRIGMRELLENFEDDASLTIGADGLFTFSYSGDVLTRTSDDVFASITETIGDAGVIPLTENRQALPFATPDGLELDRLEFKGTTLIYGLINRYSQAVDVLLRMPTVIRDGNPLEVTGSLDGFSGSGTPPQLSNPTAPLDLTGYQLTADEDSIYIEVEFRDADGNVLPPSSGSGLLIEDFAFTYAEGYLGNIVYEGVRDTIDIDFFDSFIGGDVYFEDPRVTFNFENSFGVPTEAVVNIFNIITADGQILPLESSVITEGGIRFPYPAINEVGAVKTTEFFFDRNNSNIDEVLGSEPVAIDYDISALTNPENDRSIRGFVTDSSFYKVLVDVELPLFGNVTNFAVKDTFELDLSNYEDIESIEFKLVTDNGLPLKVFLRGEFQDDSGQTLDQLFPATEEVVGAAPVDVEGLPTSTNSVTTFINWEADRTATIRTAKRLILTATFSTTLEEERSVKILSDQEVSVKIGAIVSIANR